MPFDGAGYTADFSTLDITADRIVTLNASRSIGALKFGDTSGTQNWTLASSGGSILTLDTGSGTQPSLTVANTATISAPLAGDYGFNKLGTGTLVLTGNNSLTGTISISAGIINAQSNNAFGTNSTVLQSNGANGRNNGIQLQGNITIPSGVSFQTSNDGTSGALVPYAIDNVGGNNTINGAINLTSGGGATIIQSDSGALTLGGTISPVSGQTRTLILQGASTAANTVGGTLQDFSATNTLSLTKTGTGVWRLNGINTYTGGTTLSAGRLDLGNDSALGTGALTINGGTIVPRGGGRTIANAITVGGNFTLNDLAGLNNSLTFTGTVNLGGAVRIVTVADAVTGGDNIDAAIVGVISNGGLTKDGAGTLALTGTNTYTGATSVSAGTLLVNGNIATSAVTVASGATLSGTGTAGSLTVQTGGTLAPGNAGVGTLASASATLAGTLAIEIASATSADRLNVSGSATLNGPLTINAPPGLPVGTAFTILNKTSAGAVSGAFAGLSQGSAFTASGNTWIISYTGGDGNDVTLTIANGPPPEQSWRQANFGSNWNNDAIAGDAADPDGDGVSNLLERAFGGDPNARDQNLLPAIDNTAPILSITYRKAKAATDLTYTVLETPNLSPSSWTAAQGTSTLLSDNGTVQVIRFTAPAGNATKKFLRVQVTKQ